jgi:integrase/recombinase XerD
MKNQQNTLQHTDKPQPGPALSQAVAEHLDAMRVRQCSPATVATYQHGLDEFLAFLAQRGRQRAQDVSLDDLEAFRLALTQRTLSPATIEIYLRGVRQFFAHLEGTQQLFFNPALALVIPKPPRKLLPVPTEDEILRLLDQPRVTTKCGLRDRALLETAYSTGLRLAELCRLNVSDVDFTQGQLRALGKGRKERMLPLGQQALHWLEQYLNVARPKLLKGNSDDALWLDILNKRMTSQAVGVMLRCHAHAAQIKTPLSPHGLRRACATHMLRHGAHPAQLRLLLGHATFGTLSQYLRLSITDLKNAHAQTNPGR